MQSVTAKINFIDGSGGVVYAKSLADSTAVTAPHDVEIVQARALAGKLSLDENGFILVEKANLPDLSDDIGVAEGYRRFEDFVCGVSGARRAIALQHLLRVEGGEQSGGRQPVRYAHCDHDEESYRAMVQRAVGSEGDALMRNRWFVVNVWRGLARVESAPLAMCDATTVQQTDLERIATYEYPGGPPMSTYGYPVRYSPRHRWFYFDNMEADEALIFKQFDSDPAKARWVAHSAFDDPTSPPDAAPRRSVEVRVVAFM